MINSRKIFKGSCRSKNGAAGSIMAGSLPWVKKSTTKWPDGSKLISHKLKRLVGFTALNINPYIGNVASLQHGKSNFGDFLAAVSHHFPDFVDSQLLIGLFKIMINIAFIRDARVWVVPRVFFVAPVAQL